MGVKNCFQILRADDVWSAVSITKIAFDCSSDAHDINETTIQENTGPCMLPDGEN